MQAKTFETLRRQVHAQCLIKYARRLSEERLRPTMQEIALGVFLEKIETQVVDAVLDLNRKGYCTWSSGFYGTRADIQGVDGPFVLDKTTRDKLETVDAMVYTSKHYRRNYTCIYFRPKFPNIQHIKSRWREIVALIPPRGYPAILPESYGAIEFWRNFTPSMRPVAILRLKRLILSKYNPRWIKHWQAQLRKLELIESMHRRKK